MSLVEVTIPCPSCGSQPATFGPCPCRTYVRGDRQVERAIYDQLFARDRASSPLYRELEEARRWPG